MKWQYLVLLDTPETPVGEFELNRYGAEGWELVQVLPEPNQPTAFYFRRPVPFAGLVVV